MCLNKSLCRVNSCFDVEEYAFMLKYINKEYITQTIITSVVIELIWKEWEVMKTYNKLVRDKRLKRPSRVQVADSGYQNMMVKI